MTEISRLIHHDSAPCHDTQLVSTLKEKKITAMLCPLYSPDLAILNFRVFPKLKSDMSDIKFTRIQDDLTKAEAVRLPAGGLW